MLNAATASTPAPTAHERRRARVTSARVNATVPPAKWSLRGAWVSAASACIARELRRLHSPRQARIDRPVDKRRASHPLPLPRLQSQGASRVRFHAGRSLSVALLHWRPVKSPANAVVRVRSLMGGAGGCRKNRP